MVTVKNKDIEVVKYVASEITTAHDIIEVRKGDSVLKILEANSFGFADILIDKDTIKIQYLPTVFFKVSEKAFNYKVQLDTSISIPYWREKVKAREKKLMLISEK